MTYEDLLLDLAMRDERLVVLTAENRAAIRGLPARLGGRFIDTGITEMTLVGAAAGLALRGRVPVVHALAAFLTLRAFEFIRTDIGIAHAPVKLVGYVPGFLSEANGPTHQAIEDVAVMRAIPGLRVFCPADGEELLAGLPAVIADPHPWYVRYCDKPARCEHTAPFAIGRAEVLGGSLASPAEVTLVTYGWLTGEVAAAAALLRAESREVRVVNLRTLVPVDEDALLAAAQADLVVTVEDHLRTGGLHTILGETLLRHGRTADHLSIALDTWFRPTLLDRVLVCEGFTAAHIADRVRARLRARKDAHV